MKINMTDVEIKQLTQSNLDEIMEIQQEAFDVLTDKSLLRKNTRETFLPCLEFPSLTLGAYYEDKLIAFGMLLRAGESKENLLYELDEFDKSKLDKSANIKIVIVRPKFRGNGLQRQFISQLENFARSTGVEQLFATVSPNNFVSLNNFELCGFEHVKTIKKYGGLTRVLKHKLI